MRQTLAVVLFDLDGTLLDTAPDFIRCVNQLRERHSLPALPPETIRPSVSNGARAMIETGFGLTPDHTDYLPKHTAFLDLYEATVAQETRLFPGMDNLLLWLERSRVPWGIVTNKPVRFTTPLLAALGLDKRCSAVVCPDHVTQRKPHPESLYLARKQLAAESGPGIYVGDHQRDIEAGRSAGMTTIAARYGYIDEPDQVGGWNADYMVDSVDELALLLERLQASQQ